MNKKFLTCLIAVMLVAALVLVVAPSAKAEESDLILVGEDNAVTITAENKGKILDLKGAQGVTVTFEVAAELQVIDTSFMLENGELDLTGTNAGTLTVSGNGTIAPVSFYGDYRYLTIQEGDTYSFHPFNMSITRTGVNVITRTVSLEAKFIANNKVLEKITDFGVYKLNGDTTGCMSGKVMFDFAEGKNGTIACWDLSGSLEQGMLNAERTFSTYIKIEGIEDPILGKQRIDVTPVNVLGKINELYAAGKYSGATKALATKLYTENAYLQTYLPALGAPIVCPIESEVIKAYDVYTLADKASLVIDFAENIRNEDAAVLTYSVKHNGEELTLNGAQYTFALGAYTDKITSEVFEVTASYMVGSEEKTVTYTYTLALTDSTAYRLANGGFENGLDGWNKVGNIGNISADTHYWINDPERAEGYAFGMDGEFMFSAYAPGALEGAVGTLTSSTFKVGGSGFVTFKIGAMRDGNYVYVDVVDADTKQILARYYNGLWAERTDDVKSGCTLIAFKADLSAFAGKEVFFRISDNADSGYGLFFADSFVTYYEGEPEGFNYATTVDYAVSGTIYDLFNGGFEMGAVQGWWNIGEIGVVTNANGYWGDNIPYDKDGDYLFTGVESFGADTMREGNKGTLTSSVFEVGGTGWISFKLGGGGNELCYVQVIDATTNEVLARFRQQAQQDAVLIQYVADLSTHIGKTVRIQVVDYASGGWGCVSFDSVKTYYAPGEAMPEGQTANNIFQGVYNVTNGSFENGMDGWHMNIWEAGAQNTLGWVESSEHDAGWYTKNDGRKDGNNLFTFCRPDGTNCENTKGELVGSTFTLKKDTFVSFRFGAANARRVWIELVRADGEVIARFYNEAPGKVNTEMYAYYYQYTGETADCFFRVVDDSTSDYGCFVVDDFRANLESAPEGFIAAIQ